MNPDTLNIPSERIMNIYIIRGEKVMLDAIWELYQGQRKAPQPSRTTHPRAVSD